MTAPASVREHVDALIALLTAQLGPNVGVYRAEAPTNVKPPYLVLYPGPGTPSGSLGDRFRDLDLEFQITGVGSTSEQAEWVADAARGVLLLQQPTVAGRQVQPLWQVDSSQPVARDDDLTPPLFYLPVVYHLRSDPA